MAHCKGNCLGQAVKKKSYSLGVKRCTYCAVYFPESVKRCPCCNTQLRTTAKNNKYRNKV